MENLYDNPVYPEMIGVDKKKLKEMRDTLIRAVEEGSDLQLGIVIGQILSHLNQVIDAN